ncbi:MAG: hypothetical protein HYT15_03445 [Candidatus Magasanikbacteria bacterium]|nr:hypothetical protein [Candidatus Magasanikbacteria bacterium]
MKHFAKIISIFAIFAFTLMAKPAHAFYLELPQSLKVLFKAVRSTQVYAEDNTTIAPAPTSPMPPPPPSGSDQTYPMPPQGTMYPQDPNQGQYPMPPQGMMPPSGDQYKQYPGQMPPNYDPSQNQGMMGGQNDGRQLEQIKRGMKQMARQVKQFELMIASAEKKGTAVPEEVKQKLSDLKTLLDKIQNATSAEGLEDVDISEVQVLMRYLEDARREIFEKAQQIEGMKRGMKGMETGLKMFERQLAVLSKKGITVPTDITEHVAKLRSVVDKVKNATSFEDVQEEMESMRDMMETFDEDRQQLEVLARWPQTLKQIDRQLAQLSAALKRAKLTVATLAKKGIDVQSEYTAFEEAVNKLKSVRDDAVAKMKAGNSEEAFSALEDDFFGQMDDVWQYQRVIMTMSNLGRFNSEFKRGMAQANLTIKNLKRKKVDTSELESILAQANEKGVEVLNLLKTKPVDTDMVSDALDDLENIKQEFESKIEDLTGKEDELPWEQGPQQFRRVELPQGFDKFIQPKQPAPTEQPTEGSSQLPL